MSESIIKKASLAKRISRLGAGNSHPYLIDWDQEDPSLMSAWQKVGEDLHLQNNKSKMDWEVWLKW
jgi:hypothetical protein